MGLVNIPRLLVAGTNSGAGKTTVTVSLCGALRQMGLRVALFKCGPDYLDPTYHARASGQRCHNLDGWMMGREAALSTFSNAVKDADIALIEGVMGLYDGVDATSDTGSTAEMARWLQAPVVLVVDAGGMSRSIAAMAQGFADFDPAVNVAGVICNRVGSRGHLDLLVKASVRIPVLGGLPRDAAGTFPERHLGLLTASEAGLPNELFDTWGTRATEWCDMEKLLALAGTAGPLKQHPEPHVTPQVTPHGRPNRARCRIGVAMDEAFHFYYDHNLRLLEQSGAELVRFSPLHGTGLPAVDGLYLGGGYPEVHAAGLSANSNMRHEMHEFCASGKPVYAECGGLMYLCSAIRARDGCRHEMVGWFTAEAVMNDRLQALGYAEVTTTASSLLGPSGQTFRGHQFRYSTLEWQGSPATAYMLTSRRTGTGTAEGYCRGNVIGSYVHAHWASNPGLASALVNACCVNPVSQ